MNFKHAIYFVTIGDGAMQCLEMAYKSLRAAGFPGDVYILTDSESVSFDISDNTYVKQISASDLNLNLESTSPLSTCDIRKLDMSNPRNKRMSDKFTICHCKTLVDKYINMGDYDQITYLDSDILTVGDFEKFNNYISNHKNKIITSTSRRRFLGEWPFFISPLWFKKGTLTANLSKFELFKNWHKKPLCADIISFPTNETGKSFLKNWARECDKGIDSDQAALQAVLLRQHEKDHQLAPYDLFGYGPSADQYQKNKLLEKVDSVFVHFHAAVYDSSAMKEYYEKYGNF